MHTHTCIVIKTVLINWPAVQFISNSSHEKYNKTNQPKGTIMQTDQSQINNTSNTICYEIILTHQWRDVQQSFFCADIFHICQSMNEFIFNWKHEITRWPSWKHPQRSLFCSCYLLSIWNVQNNWPSMCQIRNTIWQQYKKKNLFLAFTIWLKNCCWFWRMASSISHAAQMRKVTSCKTQR